MKAFTIGLIFLIAVSIMSGIGILLYPLIIVLGFFLKIILSLLFVILSIWLLGKFIIFVLSSLTLILPAVIYAQDMKPIKLLKPQTESGRPL